MPTSEKIQRFYGVFEIPGFIKPWVDRFFEDIEIDLVLHLANRPLTLQEIKQTFSSGAKRDSTRIDSGLAVRAYQKGVINRRDDGRFEPADFHARFDKWAMFEGWKDIPQEVRDRLNDWEFEYYQQQHADQIDGLKRGRPQDNALIYPEYVLVHEAETLVDLAAHVYLVPCNCRSMLRKCSRSVYTCLRFENDRDVGWEISKSRAKAILNRANKDGLMQSAEVNVSQEGAIGGAICNCCADCCYPHLLAEHGHAQKLWPLSRYVARHLKDRCTACGRCLKRCPFQAFTSPRNQRAKKASSKTIHFHEDRCRGCGICGTGCPEGAIEMQAIEGISSIINNLLYRRQSGV